MLKRIMRRKLVILSVLKKGPPILKLKFIELLFLKLQLRVTRS